MLEGKCGAINHFRGFIDLRLIPRVIIFNCAHDPLLCCRHIICRINSDLEISQRFAYTELVTNRRDILSNVIASTPCIADNEIGDTIYQIPLIIVGMACKICADIVSMIRLSQGSRSGFIVIRPLSQIGWWCMVNIPVAYYRPVAPKARTPDSWQGPGKF